MLVKTKGIVLKETPYSETSKVLNILTSDYGLIGVLSKGCRNMKNKLRGVSNRMVYAEFTISYKEKGLSTLTEGYILNSFKNIFLDIKKASFSFYLMELVNQVLEENNDKEIFNLLSNALIKINDGLSPELISNIVELQLLKYLGVDLSVSNCTNCGSKENILTMDINSGGAICKNCYQDGYLINPKTIHLMQLLYSIDIGKLSKLEISEEDIFRELDHFIREYYSSYTGIYLHNKEKLTYLKM